MVEIHLPTKNTQDSIKTETDKIQSIRSDTQFIRGQFPIKAGGIKSVQRGVTVQNSQTYDLNITISPVNVSKSFLIVDFVGRTGSGSVGQRFVLGALESSTRIKITLGTNTIGYSYSWQVVEFK